MIAISERPMWSVIQSDDAMETAVTVTGHPTGDAGGRCQQLGTQFGHGNKISSRLKSGLEMEIVSWVSAWMIIWRLQCGVMWVWSVICSSWLQHCSPRCLVSAVCDVSTVGPAVTTPGSLLIPASITSPAPGWAGRAHTWSTLWSHCSVLPAQLSDVSPQQNDNEIYNAAFSLSHNLRKPVPTLQPSYIRDPQQRSQRKPNSFWALSFNILVFMWTLIKSQTIWENFGQFFQSCQHLASLFQIYQHTRRDSLQVRINFGPVQWEIRQDANRIHNHTHTNSHSLLISLPLGWWMLRV